MKRSSHLGVGCMCSHALHSAAPLFPSPFDRIPHTTVTQAFKQHCISNALDGTDDDNVWHHGSDTGCSKSD